MLSDRRVEALASHIEPVTGMHSGAALLAQHLSAASAQLQQTLVNEAKTLPLPCKTPSKARYAGIRPYGSGMKWFSRARGQDVYVVLLILRLCMASGHQSSSAVAMKDKTNQAASAATDEVMGLPTTAYEVYCVPSLTPMMEQSRMTALERRLALVENKMGLHKMNLLPHADLFEAVKEMQQRIKLLDAQKVESLQKRVQVRAVRGVSKSRQQGQSIFSQVGLRRSESESKGKILCLCCLRSCVRSAAGSAAGAPRPAAKASRIGYGGGGLISLHHSGRLDSRWGAREAAP